MSDLQGHKPLPEAESFEFRHSWFRRDPHNPAAASDRKPWVLPPEVFDRLQGGRLEVHDPEEDLYTLRQYSSEGEAAAALAEAAR